MNSIFTGDLIARFLSLDRFQSDFRLSSALYRFRLPGIRFLLFLPLSIQLFYLIALSRILVPVYNQSLSILLSLISLSHENLTFVVK